MPEHSFDDLFESGYIEEKKQRKPQNYLVDMWKKLYYQAYDIEFDRMSDQNLFVACTELARFCKSNNLEIEEYILWSMKNFDVFSPRRLTSTKSLQAFMSSQIPIDASGGYFIIESGEVVSVVFQEDGQIAMDLPPDGKVYVGGKLVHAKKV